MKSIVAIMLASSITFSAMSAENIIRPADKWFEPSYGVAAAEAKMIAPNGKAIYLTIAYNSNDQTTYYLVYPSNRQNCPTAIEIIDIGGQKVKMAQEYGALTMLDGRAGCGLYPYTAQGSDYVNGLVTSGKSVMVDGILYPAGSKSLIESFQPAM